MLNTNSIIQLNRALENSFAAIKRDMNSLRSAVASQTEMSAQARRDLEALREDVVTKDKLNVVKIRLGEVSEELKRVWDSEKHLQSISDSFGNIKSLRSTIDELGAKIISLNMKINDINKNAVTEVQLKALVTELNSELNKISTDIRRVEAEREVINNKMLDKHSEKMIAKINTVRDDVSAMKKDAVNKTDLQKVLHEVNNDFDSIKKELASHAGSHKAYVHEAEVKAVVKNVNKEFDGIAAEIAALKEMIGNESSSLKKDQKQYLRSGDIKALINDIADEFADVKTELAAVRKETAQKDLDELRKSVKKLQAAPKQEVKKTLEQKPRYEAKQPKMYSKTYSFGNFFIFLAFLSLIVSIIAFYIGEQPLMDNFAIGAVVTFLIGIFLRVFAVIRSK